MQVLIEEAGWLPRGEELGGKHSYRCWVSCWSPSPASILIIRGSRWPAKVERNDPANLVDVPMDVTPWLFVRYESFKSLLILFKCYVHDKERWLSYRCIPTRCTQECNSDQLLTLILR